jgi:peptide/nickel transport system permease protein
MTAGYTLTFNTLPFVIVFFAIIVAAIILQLVTKKTFFIFVGIPVALFVGIFAAVPIDDVLDVAYHAALPVMISVFSGIISYALLVRNSMIAVTNEDYILTARAKGLPAGVVLYKHTFRNALLPLITNVGMSMAGLLGGSVLMEKIFSWPGMGQLLLDACNNGDYLLSQAILLLFAVITVVCNFITDLVYHKFDPRVKEV